MVAQQSDLEVGDFIWTGGDVHLYQNHQEQAKLQLTRKPYALPTLKIKNRPESILDYKYEDFLLRRLSGPLNISRHRFLFKEIRSF